MSSTQVPQVPPHDPSGYDVESLKRAIANRLTYSVGKDGHSATEFGLYRGRNETTWALAPGRYKLRVRRFEEFEGEVAVDRAGDVEVVVAFGKQGR
mgnify:CR=1 FL=1